MNWREQILKHMYNGPVRTQFNDRLRLYRLMSSTRLGMLRQSRGPQPQETMQQLQAMASEARETIQDNEEANVFINIFKLTVDVQDFTEEDLAVKVVGRHLIVKGFHSQRQESLCWASRMFIKKYKIPDNVDLDFMKCYITRDHVLIVTAPVRVSPGESYRTLTVRRIEALAAYRRPVPVAENGQVNQGRENEHPAPPVAVPGHPQAPAPAHFQQNVNDPTARPTVQITQPSNVEELAPPVA